MVLPARRPPLRSWSASRARSEERSQQPTCEDLVSLEPLHSPEREVLDCLAADPGRPSRLHVSLAEEEQLSAVGRPQLDDCVKREP